MSSPFKETYGPWAVVAGASEGIGAAFAHSLAARGLNVVLIARRPEPLNILAAELRSQYNIETQTLAADLAADDVLQTVAQATGHLNIGLLVYNAAHSIIGPYLRHTPEQHARTVAVNCRAPLLLSHHFGQRLAQRAPVNGKRGGMVLLSSLTAFQGTPLVASYGATKAYNLVLAEGLWDELQPQGIDVIASCAGATLTPGYINTKPEQPAGFGPPEMEPRAVAEETLAALGRTPYVIPGTANKLVSFLMRRLLPRKAAVSIMGRTMRRLYGDK
jgi:short-subunit dehydrogenase